jgi:hypothetical protein
MTRNLIAGACAIVGIALFGCSTSSTGAGGVDCSNPSRCPSDPAPSQNQVDACTKALSGECSTQYKAQVDCINTNIKCAGGKLDSNATNSACQQQISAYTSCQQAVEMDAGLTPKEAGTD